MYCEILDIVTGTTRIIQQTCNRNSMVEAVLIKVYTDRTHCHFIGKHCIMQKKNIILLHILSSFEIKVYVPDRILVIAYTPTDT
jgi:hypothetical protein